MTNELKQLPSRDLEQLSAYLDGELSGRALSSIEARLEREPSLRAALQQLRGAISVLQMLEPVAPPRSFALTPEMIGASDGRRRYPWLQLATAMAAFAFLIVVGVDASQGLLSRGLGASAPAVQQLEAPESARSAADQAAEEMAPLAPQEEQELGEEEFLADAIEGEPAAEEQQRAAAPAAELESAAASPTPPPLYTETAVEAPLDEAGELANGEPAEPLFAAEGDQVGPVATSLPSQPTDAATTPSLWRWVRAHPAQSLLRFAEISLALLVIVLTILSLRQRSVSS